ncbi:hypothetical protein C4588_08020 [Candidatus Parcubacteria bacterium]|nr:MAG: hypothetical protein C4588_08020 [Candidatus Parcubacteria bacterium]
MNSTQLNRVLTTLSDGQWHSLHELSNALSIKPKSIGSRIRDLRLPSYGKHQIEVRKTANHRIFEYRLVSTSAPKPNAVLHLTVPSPWGSAKLLSGPNKIKFLNILTMQVEHLPQTQCEIRSFNGYRRIVACDANKNEIQHLITTQDAF